MPIRVVKNKRNLAASRRAHRRDPNGKSLLSFIFPVTDDDSLWVEVQEDKVPLFRVGPFDSEEDRTRYCEFQLDRLTAFGGQKIHLDAN